MYFNESQQEEALEFIQDQNYSYTSHSSHQSPSSSCSQGHRSSLVLQTLEGGSICLLCFSNLVSCTKSPTVHVSYALSQLSQAISQPAFLQNLLTFHAHFFVSPLVHVLSSFDDEPIARQTTDLISELCSSGDSSMYGDFVARIADRLSSGALAWSRRQVYMGAKIPLVNYCLQVLDLLSTAEQAFRQRLAIGFTTLVPILRYVAEIPFHPVQTQTLKLIWNCVSNCHGIVSTSHIEELGLILTAMLKKQIDGETSMLPETFTCGLFNPCSSYEKSIFSWDFKFLSINSRCSKTCCFDLSKPL
ncbi:hypothetical protein F0562_000022 [Nyssa sinensis]|uniref:Uncharacterized protein n=1 Tax=Nyssa sinensis TaxID=561372 RepID=A0A5J5BZD2_9ASTE|nr:hypothetical protein F0562_000022 [Nyssa sinensis]